MTDRVHDDDLDFNSTVQSYIGNRRFVRREWIALEVDRHLSHQDCEVLLITGEPGIGKSALIAWLAHDHTDWLRYFIRLDQVTPLGDAGAHSFLLQIGFQLAARYPELFDPNQLRISVEQRIGDVLGAAEVVGLEVERLIASPFHQQLISITQEIQRNSGKVVGVSVEEYASDPRQIPIENLQYQALIDPALRLSRVRPLERIVILVDAIDEVSQRHGETSIVSWLRKCPRLPANIRIVLTTRHKSAEIVALRQSRAQSFRELAIDEADKRVKEDIGLYARLVESQEDLRLRVGVPKLSRFVALAMDKAGGNIGYIDALARTLDIASQRTSDEMLSHILEIRDLPDNIQGLYGLFVSELRASTKGESVEVRNLHSAVPAYVAAWPALYKPLLSILAICLEPVAMSQISAFLQVLPNDYISEALQRLSPFLRTIEGKHQFYHSSLREYLCSQELLTQQELSVAFVDMADWHRRLAFYYLQTDGSEHNTVVKWENLDPYGLKHLVSHLLYGEVWPTARRLCIDLHFLMLKMQSLGVYSVEQDIYRTRDCQQHSDEVLAELARFIGLESHHLREAPDELPQIIWNRAIAEGMSSRTIQGSFIFHTGIPNFALLNRVWVGSGGEIRTLVGHKGPVTSCKMTPDDRFIVSASVDKTLKIWDAGSGELIRTLYGHRDQINRCTFTPDGKLIVSASSDGSLKIWDFETGHLRASFGGNRGPIIQCSVTQDGNKIVSVGNGNRLRIWEIATGKVICELAHDKASSWALTDCGRCALEADGKGNIVVWELEHQQRLRTFTGTGNSVHACCANPNRTMFVSPRGNKFDFMDWNHKESQWLYNGHHDCITACAFTPDGKKVITAAKDGVVIVFGLSDYVIYRELRGHDGEVLDITLSTTGREIVTACSDGSLKFWKTESPTISRKGILEHAGPVNKCILSPNSKSVMSTSSADFVGTFDRHSSINEWDADTGRLLRQTSQDHSLQAIAFGTDEAKFVTASNQEPYLHTSDWMHFDMVGGPSDIAYVRRFSREGREWAEAPDQERFQTGELANCALSTDSRYMIVATRRNSLDVWNVETGTKISSLIMNSALSCLDISADNHILIGTSAGVKLMSIRLHDTAQILSSGDNIAIGAAAFCNGVVLTGDESGGVIQWSASTGYPIRKLIGHTAPIKACALSPDGFSAISASADKTLKLWDLKTGTCSGTLRGGAAFTCCCMSKERIAAGDTLGNVWILRWESGKAVVPARLLDGLPATKRLRRKQS